MNLSISNIAWSMEYDEEMYVFLSKNGYAAIEIAPTRIFPDNPYDKLKEAKSWAEKIKSDYNLSISSIQSIWYGKKENIFNSNEERENLFKYTEKAILFAEAIKCHNLVFGCPKNRDTAMPFLKALDISKQFFYEIGEFAYAHNTVFAIEANPVIYNTHFINYTKEAFDFVKSVNSKGLKVNIDLGTIIENKEDLTILSDSVKFINHVHISEPKLEVLKERKLHKNLFKLLKENNYNNYISVEMKNINNMEKIRQILFYIKECAM